MNDFKKFIDYYRQNEVMLTESPMRIGRHYGDDLNNSGFNYHESQRIIDTLPAITTKKILDNNLTLYRDSYDGDKFMDYWITEQPLTVCYFIFQKQSNGLQALGVWNEMRFQGSARKIFFDFYLEKYNFIISDNKHTTQGERYWKRIIQDGVERGNTVKVLTRSSEEVDIDDTESYWGRGPEFTNYKIKIYAK